MDLFDQYRSIREVAAGVKRGDRARGRIDTVKLARSAPFVGSDGPRAQELVVRVITGWDAEISLRIDDGL